MVPWLEVFPDQETSSLIFHGFYYGFFVPHFGGIGCKLVQNLPSAAEFPLIVKEKIFKELEAGRAAGPFDSPPFLNFRISPLGVVPKKEQGSFRLIHHLSYPKGASLNDEVDTGLCSVRYSSFDEAIEILQKFGHNALCYLCMCADYCTLCCLIASHNSFNGEIGHKISLQTYTSPMESNICSLLLDRFIKICDHFGVPIAEEKTVSPCTSLEFQGKAFILISQA
ncbi:unnamed protein product [Ranitomeya imitator]|uniref:Uncharacterized protein n=1 Tax=Ranitomeya imitator TaxID=111125 RepID=A0ABN9M4U9_9NEOB|nr:unnamed protein product [Ranitomeya imitator]